MKIDKITKLKNGLYHVSIKDEKEHTFKLSEDVLIEENLYKNKEITIETYNHLHSLANFSKLYMSALNYISYKMRTEKEVSDYLRKKDCVEEYITKIIKKLKNLNYLNDHIYCESYIKQQFNMNKKGPYLIERDLTKKGVSKELISKGLKLISHAQIVSNITDLIKYYEKVNKNKPLRKLRENILKNLINKGYDYEIVKSVLNNYQFKENNNEEVLLQKQLNKLLSKYSKKYQDEELKYKCIQSLLNKGFNYDDIISAIALINTEG